MPNEAEVIASRLREIRGDRSMAEMAKQVGVSRQTWFKWESGDHKPRDLMTTANRLGLSLVELFEAA